MADNQPLVNNEAPPAYSPPAGAAGGYKQIDGENKGAPAGAGYPAPYQQGGYQQGAPAGYAGPPPPAGYAGQQPPPAGYAGQQPPPAGYAYGGPQPSYMNQGNMPPGQTIVVQPQPSVVVVGGCPACRIGVLEDDFTCLGVCCAILFFPIGILCCLAMRQRHCPNCGAVFG